MHRSLALFAATWLASLSGTVASATFACYRTVVQRYILPSELGALALGTVRPKDVRAFLLRQRREGWSPGFVRLMQTVLAGIFDDAVQRGILNASPAANLWKRVPPELRVHRNPDAHTPPDGVATAIWEHLQQVHPAIARVVAVYEYTACRRNEALGLQADDRSPDRHTLTIARQWYGSGQWGPTKGRRIRTIDLAEPLVPVLDAALVESDRIALRLGCPPEPRWMFRSPYTGVPYNPGHITRVVGAAAEHVARRRYGPKAFRHAVVTALIYRGEPLEYVRDLAGHANITTTYAYKATRTMRRRSAVNGLSKL